MRNSLFHHGAGDCRHRCGPAGGSDLRPQPAWAAKNVILMIADGGGHNTWLAASMYQGKVGKQVYDQPGWLRFSCCTYPLNLSTKPTGD